MYLDREVVIGGSEVDLFPDPSHFSEKSELLPMTPYMLDDGIGVSDIEALIGKRQFGPVSGECRYLGVAFMESLPIVFESNGGDASRIAVESLEEIVMVGVLCGIDSDIEDSGFGCGLGQCQKLEPLFGPAST